MENEILYAFLKENKIREFFLYCRKKNEDDHKVLMIIQEYIKNNKNNIPFLFECSIWKYYPYTTSYLVTLLSDWEISTLRCKVIRIINHILLSKRCDICKKNVFREVLAQVIERCKTIDPVDVSCRLKKFNNT